MPLRALLFDLDDTLIVDEVVSLEAFAKISQEASERWSIDPTLFQQETQKWAQLLWANSPLFSYCNPLGISAIECLWGNFLGEEVMTTQLREWSLKYRIQVFQKALDTTLSSSSLGIEKEAATILANCFAKYRRQFQRLMPHAETLLSSLRASSYQIGLLTNGNSDLQREKIKASGLATYFDAIVISGEHSIGKPDPRIFHKLLQDLKVSPQEAVMIGNSLERDIQGAHHAQIYSIWLKVLGSEEPANVQPHHTLHCLSELLPWLEKRAF